MSLSSMRIVASGLILNEAATIDSTSNNTLQSLCDFAKKTCRLLEPYNENYTILDAVDMTTKLLNSFLEFATGCNVCMQNIEREITENDLIGEEKIYLKEFIGSNYNYLPVIRHSKLFLTKGHAIAYENLDSYAVTRVNNRIFSMDNFKDSFKAYYRDLLRNELDADCINLTTTGYWSDNGVIINNALEFLKFLSSYDRLKRFEEISQYSYNLRESHKYATRDRCSYDRPSEKSGNDTIAVTHVRVKFLLSEITRIKLQMLETQSIDKTEEDFYKVACSTINLIAAFCFPVGYGLYELQNVESARKATSEKMEELAAKYASGAL